MPNPQLLVILHAENWLDHSDDNKLEDEALLEKGLELGVGFRDAEVGVGAVERVQDVAELLEVILESLE